MVWVVHRVAELGRSAQPGAQRQQATTRTPEMFSTVCFCSLAANISYRRRENAVAGVCARRAARRARSTAMSALAADTPTTLDRLPSTMIRGADASTSVSVVAPPPTVGSVPAVPGRLPTCALARHTTDPGPFPRPRAAPDARSRQTRLGMEDALRPAFRQGMSARLARCHKPLRLPFRDTRISFGRTMRQWAEPRAGANVHRAFGLFLSLFHRVHFWLFSGGRSSALSLCGYSRTMSAAMKCKSTALVWPSFTSSTSQ